jgi:uncharacterized repeat protein (TIGR02543 family)
MDPKKLLTTLTIVSVVLIAGCKKDDFVETIGVCPIVVSTSPANAATGVFLDKIVTATFNENMNPVTITSTTYTLKQGTTPVTGTVSYTGTTASFTPSSPLTPNTTYTGRVTSSVKDLMGNALQEDYVWTFTTGIFYTLNVTAANGTVVKNPNQASYANGTIVELTATPNAGYTFTSWSGDANGIISPASIFINANKNVTANFTLTTSLCPTTVDLGLSGNYVILSKAGISTTGTTSITGNMGVSPITSTAITGDWALNLPAGGTFSTSIRVTGNVYASDYATPTPANLSTAVSNMETAFTTANGLVVPAPVNEFMAGNLNGQTLSAGIYKWSTGVVITNGIVLDGGGDNCSTFIFQIAQDLTVANGAIITLQNGAQAKNIFWVVAGSKAELGTTVDFSGNILCQTLISLNTGAVVHGRLLAQTAVTLNASTVILP